MKDHFTLGDLVNNIAALPIMELLLFLIIVSVIAVLAYVQFKKDTFDLRWIIRDDITKRPSLHKLGQFVALVVSTWAFVALTIRGQLTETFFAIYMSVWAGATLLDKYASRPIEPMVMPKHDD